MALISAQNVGKLAPARLLLFCSPLELLVPALCSEDTVDTAAAFWPVAVRRSTRLELAAELTTAAVGTAPCRHKYNTIPQEHSEKTC
jgi:hypothetical protein